MNERPKRASIARVAFCGFIGLVVSLLLTLGLLALPIGMPEYGYLLFVITPAVMGFVGSVLLDWKEPHPMGDHVVMNMLAMLIASFALLVFAVEGLICMIMAFFPVALGAIAGSAVGRWLVNGSRRGTSLCSVLVLLPALIFAEVTMDEGFAYRHVSSSIIVDAKPEEIWPLLHHLDLPPAKEWMFRTGIAHPLNIRTEGDGVGARRFCNLSTGAMPERVTVWDEHRVLAFEVIETPPTMHEFNPFGQPNPHHLTGFYECLEGRFTLEPLRDGTTRLIGDSLYRHRYAPTPYWNLWTDGIVRAVHLRVLQQIRQQAETP
jgi:hypothetical protein